MAASAPHQDPDIGTCFIELFRQAGDTCWMDSLIAALFLSDHIREALWPHFFIFDKLSLPLHRPLALHPRLNKCPRSVQAMAEAVMETLQQGFREIETGSPADTEHLRFKKLCATGGAVGNMALELGMISGCLGSIIDYTQLGLPHEIPEKPVRSIIIGFRGKVSNHAVSIFVCEGHPVLFDNNYPDLSSSYSRKHRKRLYALIRRPSPRNIQILLNEIYPVAELLQLILIHDVQPVRTCLARAGDMEHLDEVFDNVVHYNRELEVLRTRVRRGRIESIFATYVNDLKKVVKQEYRELRSSIGKLEEQYACSLLKPLNPATVFRTFDRIVEQSGLELHNGVNRSEIARFPFSDEYLDWHRKRGRMAGRQSPELERGYSLVRGTRKRKPSA